jgi:DNA-directed RNA polymerase subunit M/transcription elongation factor TFIIS
VAAPPFGTPAANAPAPPQRATVQLPVAGVERRVKYFGSELPPKCALRNCWLSDDGKHYYCTDFTCNRHKYRRTKHDRYSRYAHRNPEGRAVEPAPKEGLGPLLYFKCPQCASGDIQMRLLQNRYECAQCGHLWR